MVNTGIHFFNIFFLFVFCPSQIKKYIITGLVRNFLMHFVRGWHILCRKENTISVTLSSILLQPLFIGIKIIPLRPKEVGNHRPIVLAVVTDILANVVLKDYGSIVPTPNSEFIVMHCTFLDLLWNAIVPNSTISFRNRSHL